MMAELARVESVEPDWNSMSHEEQVSVSYTTAEKAEMYRCRQDLRFLPPTGKNGGVIQAVARDLDLSRQYVHQVFFPKDPNKLFSGRATTQKRAWQCLVRRLKEHALLPKYKSVFETILSGRRVEVTIPVSKFKWIRKNATRLVPGIKIDACNDTVPTTYVLTPPPPK